MVGSEKITVELKSDNVVARSGGGYKSLEALVAKDQLYHEKVLVSHMITNDESLEWVVGELAQGKKLKTNEAFKNYLKKDKAEAPGIKK